MIRESISRGKRQRIKKRLAQLRGEKIEPKPEVPQKEKALPPALKV